MNWRKQERELERRYARGFALVGIVLGLLMALRSALMFMDDRAWVSINARYLQPVYHTPIYDVLLSAVLLFFGIRSWMQYRRKWGPKAPARGR